MTVRALLYLAGAGDTAVAASRLAGLLVAERAVLAALRAGCSPVGVPRALRDTALGAALESRARTRAAVAWLDETSPLAGEGPVLLLPAAAAGPATDLRRLCAAGAGAHLTPADDGAPVVLLDRLPPALGDRIARALPVAEEVRREAASRAPRVVPGSWARVGRDPADRRRSERRLYADLGSAIDSRLDTLIHRPLSRLLTRVAVALGVGPNAVSTLSLAIGLLAVWTLSAGTPATVALAIGLYYVSVVLDHSDGEVARLTFAESRLGSWLDLVGDSIVHMLGALALGLAAEHSGGRGLGAGVAAMAGFGMCALVARTAPRPAADAAARRVLRAVGTRDGYYVLLLLALGCTAFAPAALPQLVLLAALGSHAYWISGLALRGRGGLGQRGRETPRATRSRRWRPSCPTRSASIPPSTGRSRIRG